MLMAILPPIGLLRYSIQTWDQKLQKKKKITELGLACHEDTAEKCYDFAGNVIGLMDSELDF